MRYCNQRYIDDGCKEDSHLMKPYLKDWVVRDLLESIDMGIQSYLIRTEINDINLENTSITIKQYCNVLGIDCDNITLELKDADSGKELEVLLKLDQLKDPIYLKYYME